MKIELKNVSYSEFVGMDSDAARPYVAALSYGKFAPVDSFGFGSFFDLNFGIVKEIQLNVHSGISYRDTIMHVAKFSGKTEKQISRDVGIFDLQQQRLFFRSQIELIDQAETELGHTPSALETAAGIGGFSDFKSFPQYDTLAQGQVWMFEKIENTKYSVCFTKLLYNARLSEFERKINRLASKVK